MLSNVKHTITDFGIGSSVTKGEGLHIKVGVSNTESNIPITITDAMTNDEIREKVGNSPLADSLIDSLSSGCRIIYAMPVKVSENGAIKEESKNLTTGTIAVEGNPTNAFKLKVVIVNSGALNVGIFKYYLNDLESDELTIPQNGTYSIDGYGVNIKFTGENFVKDEYIEVSTTRPKTNIANILETLEYIKKSSLNFEFIHILGESEKEVWASLVVEEQNFFDKYKKPCIFVCEARKIGDEETIDQYAEYLRNEKKGIISRGLQVVVSRATYMRDGKEVEENLASKIMGLYAKANVQQSIGQVDSFDLVGVLELMPKGMENINSELDDLGYTVAITYAGVEGAYINNARTFAKVGSDYEFVERTRTMYKAVRETLITATLKLHSQVDMSNPEVSLKQITEFINVPVERMVENKELSSARVIIPEGQDILATSKFKFKIRAIPIGILREIEIDMGFENNV
nr:DUF2586 family protein [uncultured Tyzzerella sp.]